MQKLYDLFNSDTSFFMVYHLMLLIQIWMLYIGFYSAKHLTSATQENF